MVVAACLLLEYGVSAAAVAVGWSQYLNELLDNLFGFTIPETLAQAPEQGGILNVPAVILIVLCSLLLLRGASESAKVNAIMVMIKLGVLLLFIVLGISGLGLRQPLGLRALRRQRDHLGGGHHLLLLHRPRRRLDRRRGGEEPAEEPAAGDHLRAADRDRRSTSLVTVVAVAAQPAAELRGPGGRARRDPRGRDRVELAGDGARRRRGDLDLQRHAGGDLRPDADPVRDGPRRDDPADLPQAEPAHAAPRSSRPSSWRVVISLLAGRAADRLPGRDDQHRHARGVPRRVDRRDGAAPAPARPPARLQGPALSAGADRSRSAAASGSSRTSAR